MHKLKFGIILTSLLFINTSVCYAKFYSCKEYWNDDGKIEKKSCNSSYKSIPDSPYVLKSNKAWLVETHSYRNYDGGPGCAGVICGAPKLNIRPQIEREKKYFYSLNLDINSAHVINQPNKNCGYKSTNYIADNNNVYYGKTKIKNADPQSFKIYEMKYNDIASLGCNLAWDKNSIYQFGKPLSVQVTGEVNLINESLISTGKQIFEIEKQQDKLIFTPRNDISPNLYALPGGLGLSTDNRNLFYYGRAFETLPGIPPTLVTPVCPVPGFPHLECHLPDNNLSDRMKNEGNTVIRTGNSIWVQSRRQLQRGVYKINIRPQDKIYFFIKGDDYGNAYLIINHTLYNLGNYNISDKYYSRDPVVFSDFLMSYNFMFVDRYGVIYDEANQSIDNRRTLFKCGKKNKKRLHWEKDKKTIPGTYILSDKEYRYFIVKGKLAKVQDKKTKQFIDNNKGDCSK
ncbi:DKNYY domain-containing protein [Klebsiella aerogenes]|uniref:DKNYY domain-containing protein n=1 Tax=Klebsiella aerogenes TaxID=548 RepID=UPI00280E1623|nr:DKNYY domain-containing protein [Klebsiella aerogenes]MDQ8581510.1 DKNYY domain-containing protein [Klebsiella aerogenes]